MTTRVLYPGSFDPIHNGHIEIVETAAEHFDEVVVAAVGNPDKGGGVFTLEERAEIIEEVFAHLPNVSGTVYSDLVVRLAAELEVDFIIKGLRAVSDFESELQMAQLNKAMTGVETMFLPSTSSSSFIASKFVREIARFDGDVSSMVPGPVLARLHAKLGGSD
ncbi:MAG: pantetheine-phosphate adenylyltransferase [Actinomycetota bacterium]